MGDDEPGSRHLPDLVHEHPAHPDRSGGVETGEGLVENDQRGLVDQGAGNGDAARLSA